LQAIGKSHLDAKRLCEADGARLAYAPYGQTNINAMQKYVSMAVGIRGSNGPHNHYLLVDGTDAVTENIWLMPNGNTNVNYTYIWNQSESIYIVSELTCQQGIHSTPSTKPLI
jgi:hypothetical protein